MGAKWILVILFGMLGAFRALSPAFFKHWIKTEFNTLFEIRSGFSVNFLMMIGCTVFGGLSLSMLELHEPKQELYLLIPCVIIYRVMASFGIATLLNVRGSAVKYQLGLSIAASSYVYLVTAFIVLICVMTSLPSVKNLLMIIGIGHLVGFIWFSVSIPAFQNIKGIGTKYYAMLYLCILELIPIYLVVN